MHNTGKVINGGDIPFINDLKKGRYEEKAEGKI